MLAEGGSLEHTVDGPTWLAAVARGPATGLAPAGLAHTTPVYVDVDGARVARADAAEWCLGLVDGLERLLAEHGVFAEGQRERRLADYAELLDDARRYYREAGRCSPPRRPAHRPTARPRAMSERASESSAQRPRSAPTERSEGERCSERIIGAEPGSAPPVSEERACEESSAQRR